MSQLRIPLAVKKVLRGLPLEKGISARVISNAYHLFYYDSTAWMRNTFLGYPIFQCPMDLQIYQELFFRVRPSFVVQTGIAEGGSLLYFASLLDLLGSPADALVVGVDIGLTERAKTLKHPRIRMVEGSSIDAKTLEQVRTFIPGRKGIVILDSDHTQKHVAAEITAYKDFVAPGSYLVVEDTNINGHPVKPMFGPGPFEAVEDFLRTDKNFENDDAIWRNGGFSFHQGGWLKKIR